MELLRINNHKDIGFTIIEVLVVLFIIALIATSFSKMFGSTRQSGMQSLSKRLYAGLTLARSEAMKRANPVGLCRSLANSSTCNHSENWQDGWVVFADIDGNSNIKNDEIIRFYQDLPDGYFVQWQHSNSPIIFDGRGRVNTAGEFKICTMNNGSVVSLNNSPIITISITASGQIYKDNRIGVCI